MPFWLSFVLAALAVWRLTHLVVLEHGPWDLISRLRERLGETMPGRLISCFKCLSVWIAIPFTFFVAVDWLERAVVWLALSGAAILLEEQTTGPLVLEQGVEDELLRRDEVSDPEAPTPTQDRRTG